MIRATTPEEWSRFCEGDLERFADRMERIRLRRFSRAVKRSDAYLTTTGNDESALPRKRSSVAEIDVFDVQPPQEASDFVRNAKVRTIAVNGARAPLPEITLLEHRTP